MFTSNMSRMTWEKFDIDGDPGSSVIEEEVVGVGVGARRSPPFAFRGVTFMVMPTSSPIF